MRSALAVLLLAAPVFAGDVTGAWKGYSTETDKYGNVTKSPMTMNLQQSGSAVTGTVTTAKGTALQIASGSESNSIVTVVVTVGSGSTTFRLNESGTQLAGSATTPSGKAYSVTFTKQ